MKVNRIMSIKFWCALELFFFFFFGPLWFLPVPAAPMRNVFFLFHCIMKCRKLEVYLPTQPLIRVKRYTINHPRVHDR